MENPAAAKHNVVMLGASGAVGGEVLQTFLQMPEIGSVDLLLRRNLPLATRATEHVVDVLNAGSYRDLLPHHDVAICTFGVGQPSKVSPEEFARIDKQAVLDFAAACKQAGVKHFSLLGSVGADATSRSFYLRRKGELRDAIANLGFERFSIFQPSMILTPQNRYGLSQALLLATWPVVSVVLVGGLAKFKGIRVADLGRAIARNVVLPGQAYEVLQWPEIVQRANNSRTA